MRESKRKQHGQANAKITGHVALLPPSGVVTVTITPADQSVYGFEILGSGVTFKGEGASRRNGQRGAYVYEIAGLGVLDDPEEAYSKITVQRFYRGASNSELSSSHDHLLARTPVLSYRFRQSISVKQQLTRPSTVETFHSSLHGDMEVPLIHVDIVDRAIIHAQLHTTKIHMYYHIPPPPTATTSCAAATASCAAAARGQHAPPPGVTTLTQPKAPQAKIRAHQGPLMSPGCPHRPPPGRAAAASSAAATALELRHRRPAVAAPYLVPPLRRRPPPPRAPPPRAVSTRRRLG